MAARETAFSRNSAVSKSRRQRRLKKLFDRHAAPGTAPGSLVADPTSPAPEVRLMAYDGDKFVERELRTPAEIKQIPQILAEHRVTWINVDGMGDAELVRQLGEIFGLHPLALEDVLNTHQRSKVEQYGDVLFIVARMLEGGTKLEVDQLGMFLGKRFVVTFQHLLGDCFDPLRENIRRGRGILRTSGPDYLAYAVLDGVVDSYFPVLEDFGEQIENLEEAIIVGCGPEIVPRIHVVKGKLIMLRRAVWPLREALHVLVRDPIPVIHDETRVYFRDCADHTFQIIDLLETYRELNGDLMELYHSSLSNRTNDVMRVLTVIATIFIPLTFIVGVYGMNFDVMPELRWRWGYAAVWAVMLSLTSGMLVYFWRKGWLFAGSSVPGMPHTHDTGEPPST
jgi:magnesium transporter